MLVASLGGVYLPQLRQRQLSKILTNASAMSLAALGASATSEAFWSGGPSDTRTAIAAIALASLCYWVINNAVVAAYVATREGLYTQHLFVTLTTSDAGVLVWCGLASAMVIGSGQLSVQLLGIAVCVGGNALATSRRLSIFRRAEAFVGGNPFLSEVVCWSTAVIVLAATGGSPTMVAILAGSGVGYTVWTGAHATFEATASTAALTFVAICWLDPLAQVAAAILGIALLCVAPLGPSALRNTCVAAGALMLSASIGRHPESGASFAFWLFICVIGAATMPQLLAALHECVKRRASSLLTLAGMAIPSAREGLVVLGSYFVLAAFYADPLAGTAAFAAWLPMAWANSRRDVNYRRNVAASSH
jgi:hypothetical protein